MAERILISRATVEQVLEALELMQPEVQIGEGDAAIDALLAALAQQQAEPVERKPLTDDEIEALFKSVDSEDKGRFAIVRGFARALEAAHGIKEAK